jgi:nucleolar MIF4G domain-containing protein 1
MPVVLGQAATTGPPCAQNMAPPKGKKLALPASLLKEIGAQAPGGGKRRQNQQLSRKDQRKAQRVQKKQAHRAPRPSPAQPSRYQSGGAPVKNARPKAATTRGLGPGDDDEDDSDVGLDEDEDASELGDEDGFDLDEDEEDEDEDKEQIAPQPSKSERRKLEKEDAEIAALEKKLGLKKGKKSKGDDDGLDDLLADLDDLDEDEELTSRKKRKAEADDWLAHKRRKASAAAAAAAAAASSSKATDLDNDDDDDEEEYSFGEDEDDDMEDGGDGLSDLGNSDYSELEGDEDDEDDDGDGDGQDFDGFSDDDDEDSAASTPRQKENPYVAPTTNVAKYVPPSLRKKAESMNEVDAQLRRRVQGLMNRLTNENMLGILKDFTALYDQFPRQSVTSSLTDLVIALVCSPERRPDSFFTMIAGFTAASQKALGIHVSASMVQQFVEVFKQHHDRASGDQSDAASKHLIALLAELYNMQVVGSKLIFDYVRLFLGNLSELNTELLLRIIQMCGPSLRREDPHALKEIISLIKPADLKNVSVRTSFMIDEMRKLQSNKAKAAARNKDLAEMRTQIRKRIGTLSSSWEIQPLGMGLKEIENADKNGKWWLVGASWSGNREKDKEAGNGAPEGGNGDDAADFAVADDDDLGIPDLWQLAKQQGFNTEVRQQVFVALHSATDYENAEMLLRKLRLNKHQRKELAEVIVRSGEAQAEFNRYYWLVASRFCGDRELAFQFKRCLTQRFKRMGEDIDTGDDYEAEDEDYDTRQVVNVGKFYGNLVAHGSLGLDMLRYRNLAALQEKTQWFVEVLLITVLQESGRKGLQRILGALDRDLARGVQYFLRKHVRKTDLLKGKEKKTLRKQCEVANGILEESLAATTTIGEGAGDELGDDST